MNNPDLLVCYVIMRTDLASLNPGKAMAQAHHNYGALKRAARTRNDKELLQQYLQWQKISDQDFGTVITLGGNEEEINDALAYADRINAPVLSGWVWDDTYPLRDGDVTHLIRLNTNAFVFGTKLRCEDIVGRFELHE